jgi:hypothetical protein
MLARGFGREENDIADQWDETGAKNADVHREMGAHLEFDISR